MGREVKRVNLDFDWPIGKIWPGYMGHICSEEIEYCISRIPKKTHNEICGACRHAARLAGIEIKSYGCPNWGFDPAAGDGWQMWETTTEGSPISPVFKTPEELAKWLTDNKASAMGSTTADYDHWLTMIKGPGWAPTLVVNEKTRELKTGVDFMAETEKG